jgi:outer membrane receptor protein involved in Fe transport
VHIVKAILIAALLGSLAQPVLAAERQAYDVPAGPLSDALDRLGQQAGITIGATDPAIAGVRSGSVRGSFTLRQALRRLLAGTGLDFEEIDKRTIRVIRARRPEISRTRPAPSPLPPAPAPPWPDIIVTASKRGTALEDFPATLNIVTLDQPGGTSRSALGTAAIVSRLPMLFSTNLGPGRNKLFIRGVADSSFTGPTQATVGQYLGDVRLNYNAPDPNLNLYDIARIEVVEGPQGTLYGAGSLGGILRLVPNDPKLVDIEASMAAGATATEHGAAGYDIAAMGNLPIVSEMIALRLVAYRSVDGGYIDDAGRNVQNVNRTSVDGGRATLRISPGDDWTIDLGGTVQNLNSRDSQYAERGLPPLTRSSAIAQPFDNDYTLWQAVVRKGWATLQLVSATGLVRHDVGVRYDATGFPGTTGPSAFDETSKITLITHETRLSRSMTGGTGWIAGLSFVSDVDRIHRQIGDPAAPAMIVGVRNEVLEGAVFGEGTIRVVPRVTATFGGRITYAHLAGEPLDLAGDPDVEPKRDEVRVMPTAALAWKPRVNLLAFIRYQQGFRPGGLSVDPSGTPSSVQRFRADTIATTELGMRLGKRGQDRLTAAFALSYTRWKNIQADLVGPSGLPFTANVGNGRIYGLEASAIWMPISGMSAELATFINDSALSDPVPGFGTKPEELPNIPRAGARAAISYRTNLNSRLLFTLDAAARYVGESALGVGSLSQLDQGDYVDISAGIRLDRDNWGLTLDVANASNVVGNRFALGNPIDVAAGRQTTPLRPRNIRIGLQAGF